MQDLQREFHMAIVMITHDLGVVAELASEVLVMYGGRIVERASVDELFNRPQMPYTWGLLGSLPRVDVIQERLQQISGQPPSLLRPPPGCSFNPRCEFAMDICREAMPELEDFHGPDHQFRCHLDEQTRVEAWGAKRAAMGEEMTVA
jgi:peptide/nickel transport system ATP-binding protein